MSIGSHTAAPSGQRRAATHSSSVSPSTAHPAGRHSVSGSATASSPSSRANAAWLPRRRSMRQMPAAECTASASSPVVPMIASASVLP